MSDVKDDTGSTYSVYVPSTNAYLRLGSADTSFETATQFPSAEGDFVDGAFINTSGTVNINADGPVNIVAQAVNITSTDHFQAVYGADNLLSSASWQGPNVASVSYQAALAFNLNVANTANMLVGNSLTYWLGNDASTGTGSLLWSNFGHTQNIFGGQVVNLTNNMFEVQGYGGGAYTSSTNVAVSNTVDIGQAPNAIAMTGTARALVKSMGTIAKVASMIAADLTLGEVIAVGTALNYTSSEKAIKGTMIATMAEIAAVETCVLVMQAMTISAGLIASSATDAPKLTALSITPGTLQLTAMGSRAVWSAVSTMMTGFVEFFTE